jgi:putative oxidoreductase
MKIVVMMARILLGLIFAFFGSNMLFHFLPNPPLPPGQLKDFSTVLAATHYDAMVGLFQFLGGLLLLVNRYVAVGLIILAAVLVNILATHILVMRGGFPIPIFVTFLWLLVFWQHRSAFSGIFQARIPE